jgi:hypothetical protein
MSLYENGGTNNVKCPNCGILNPNKVVTCECGKRWCMELCYPEHAKICPEE